MLILSTNKHHIKLVLVGWLQEVFCGKGNCILFPLPKLLLENSLGIQIDFSLQKKTIEDFFTPTKPGVDIFKQRVF